MVTIREEEPGDAPSITDINLEAFAGPAEARLVADLRRNNKIVLSLVALINEQLVGHILFTPMNIVSPAGETYQVVGLGPLAVLPEFQQQGVGTALCQEGLARCREADHTAALVLGHPAYYPRVGFRPAADFQIRCAYDVPPEAFMAVELQEDGLEGVTGVAHYQPEFDGV